MIQTGKLSRYEMAYNARRLRERTGMTQVIVADLLYTTQTQISRYENGHQIPRADMLHALAVLYGCSVDDFYRPIPAMGGASR